MSQLPSAPPCAGRAGRFNRIYEPEISDVIVTAREWLRDVRRPVHYVGPKGFVAKCDLVELKERTHYVPPLFACIIYSRLTARYRRLSETFVAISIILARTAFSIGDFVYSNHLRSHSQLSRFTGRYTHGKKKRCRVVLSPD